MATRVIAAQDKTSSGAGDDVQIKAGNANTSGAGGSIIFQPGVQATTGGNGTINFNDTSGNPVAKLSTDSNYLTVTPQSSKGFRIINSTSSTIFTVTNGIPDFPFGAGFNSQAVANVGSIYNAGYAQMLVINPKLQWPTNTPTSAIENGSVGQIKVTDGSTGGGSFAYTSATPTALSTNPTNDLVLTGSAFQRLSSSSAVALTGIAPPATGSHVDGRLIWLYNVGSFNITLKHSQTSTATNQFVNEGGGDIVLGPNRVAQAIYDSTTGKWRLNGETYPYVFPTADGTNGQVLTTNGSGTLSWATVSAGASASGTTNYIAKFTGTSTLGNSLIFDNGTNVGIGTASPGTKLHVEGTIKSGRTDTVNEGGQIELARANDNTTAWYLDTYGNSATTANTLRFVDSINAAVRMAIDATGNVGVGTATPSNNLSIGASAGKIGFQRGSGDGEYCTIGFKSTTGNDRYVFEINNSSGTGELRLNQGGTSTPIGMTFYTNNAEKMRIDSSGNVGIGTASPADKLDISGGQVGLRITSTTTGDPFIRLANGASAQTEYFWSRSQNKGVLRTGAAIPLDFYANSSTESATPHLRISTSGTIGINNTAPGAMLQIDTAATGTKGQIIKAFLGQTANLSEWQDSTGTVLASIDSAGRMTLAAGAAASNADLYFNNSTSVIPAIKWNGNSGAYGLRFYSGASLIGAFQDNGAARATSFQTWNAMNLGDYYVQRASAGIISFGSTAGAEAISMGCGSGSTFGYTTLISTSYAATRGLVVKGVASQSANLTEWQDSTGTVVAAVSPTGAFTGSSFTPYGTFNSTTTIFGNNYWTPNLSGVSNPSTGTFTKTAGTLSWDSQAYSSEGYTKNVYCAARASQTNGYIMFGLNSDPATDANYSSLDYAWYFRADGIVEIYESNVSVSTYGSYTTSTVLSITYDGSNVQYWKDGVIQRTVARSTGNPLYFDTSFYSTSASLNAVQFGPIGQPFGISGTSGYLPKFTSQQTLGNSIVYDNGTNVGIGTASPVRLLDLYHATTPVFAMHNSTTGTANTDGFLIYLSGSDSFIQNKEPTGVMGFIVGGDTERMRIDSSGNVGVGAGARIGSGTGYINAGATAAGYLELYNATSGATTLMNTGAFNVLVGTNNTERIRVTSSGLVGIGTSTIAGNNPLADLHVNDASGYGSLQLSQSPAGATIDTGGEIQFAATYRSANDLTQVARIRGLRENATNNNWAGYLAFYTSTGSDNPSASTERMRINSSGNVGIGTTSPGSKLTIKGQGTSPSIAIQRTSDTTEQFKLINAEATAYTTVRGTSSGSWATVLENSNANFMISTNNAGGTGGSIFLDANSVGINTTSPGARLQVDTGATGTKGMLLKAAASQTANLLEVQNSAGVVLTNIDANGHLTVSTTTSAYTYYSSSTTTRWATGHDSSNGYFRIIDYVWDSTTRLMITPGGNVVLGNAGGDQTSGPKLLVTTGPDTYGGTGAARKGIIVRGSASQTANLQEWQNSSSTTLAYMDANGNFAAVTKSFLIPHPTPAKAAEGKKLRYASLEGPENGVYFRGRLEGENVIILPDYWVDLVDPDSITVNLTARKFAQPSLFVVDANAERVVIDSDREINCDFVVFATRRDIAKLEVEIDGN